MCISWTIKDSNSLIFILDKIGCSYGKNNIFCPYLQHNFNFPAPSQLLAEKIRLRTISK